ncbi:MAG: cation:proton antiporter [Terriglobia bacterium]
MINLHASSLLFFQLAFILAVCRAMGWVARKIRQPQVVAEMIAGAMLGPSLFGLLFPVFQVKVFPKESMGILHALSQIGLILYMFLVGLEFRADFIRKRLRSAASVSLAGVLAPLCLGGLLAIAPISHQEFFTSNVTPWQRFFFLGAAMSITAMPVLARILGERGLTGTSLGTLALAAGSIDDAMAWCLLAVVLSCSNGHPGAAIWVALGGLLYVGMVFLPLKSLFRRVGELAENRQEVSGRMFSFTLIALMLSAWFTDAIGIYAVFGAFILGTAMPRGVFSREMSDKLAPMTHHFLLPLYFVYSGLNTRIDLLNSPRLWGIALLVFLASCSGKGIACWLAARWHGESSRDARAIGTLMNARGLMELILLNIGLERGIITPTLFTILVLMALATTVMALPLFDWVYGREEERVLAGTQAPDNA